MRRNGTLEPESNVKFDQSLKSRNEAWGVRDIVHLQREGSQSGIHMVEMVAMPSNNWFLHFEKDRV